MLIFFTLAKNFEKYFIFIFGWSAEVSVKVRQTCSPQNVKFTQFFIFVEVAASTNMNKPQSYVILDVLQNISLCSQALKFRLENMCMRAKNISIRNFEKSHLMLRWETWSIFPSAIAMLHVRQNLYVNVAVRARKIFELYATYDSSKIGYFLNLVLFLKKNLEKKHPHSIHDKYHLLI